MSQQPMKRYWAYKHNLIDHPVVGMDGLVSDSVRPVYLAADVEAVESACEGFKVLAEDYSKRLLALEIKHTELKHALAAKEALLTEANTEIARRMEAAKQPHMIYDKANRTLVDGQALLAHRDTLQAELANTKQELEEVRSIGLEQLAHRQNAEAELARVSKEYNELIYAVGMKHQGETRHQTALRYIREHENRDSGPSQEVQPSRGEQG
jgi:hypothetical protein